MRLYKWDEYDGDPIYNLPRDTLEEMDVAALRDLEQTLREAVGQLESISESLESSKKQIEKDRLRKVYNISRAAVDIIGLIDDLGRLIPLLATSLRVIEWQIWDNRCAFLWAKKDLIGALDDLESDFAKIKESTKNAGYNSYSEYLQSSHWKEVRSRALAMAENRCSICGNPGNLCVHHNNYERLGKERDSDIIVLCMGCHKIFHNKNKFLSPDSA